MDPFRSNSSFNYEDVINKHYSREFAKETANEIVNVFNNKGRNSNYIYKLSGITYVNKNAPQHYRQMLIDCLYQANKECGTDFELIEDICKNNGSKISVFLKDKMIKAIDRGFSPAKLVIMAGLSIDLMEHSLDYKLTSTKEEERIDELALKHFFPEKLEQFRARKEKEGLKRAQTDESSSNKKPRTDSKNNNNNNSNSNDNSQESKRSQYTQTSETKSSENANNSATSEKSISSLCKELVDEFKKNGRSTKYTSQLQELVEKEARTGHSSFMSEAYTLLSSLNRECHGDFELIKKMLSNQKDGYSSFLKNNKEEAIKRGFSEDAIDSILSINQTPIERLCHELVKEFKKNGRTAKYTAQLQGLAEKEARTGHTSFMSEAYTLLSSLNRECHGDFELIKKMLSNQKDGYSSFLKNNKEEAIKRGFSEDAIDSILSINQTPIERLCHELVKEFKKNGRTAKYTAQLQGLAEKEARTGHTSFMSEAYTLLSSLNRECHGDFELIKKMLSNQKDGYSSFLKNNKEEAIKRGFSEDAIDSILSINQTPIERLCHELVKEFKKNGRTAKYTAQLQGLAEKEARTGHTSFMSEAYTLLSSLNRECHGDFELIKKMLSNQKDGYSSFLKNNKEEAIKRGFSKDIIDKIIAENK